MYGKKYEGIIRSSLLIDEQGKVVDTWYKVSPKDTVNKALKTLEET
jgi:peroxiredoxin Q/BCP